jgi:hypothetical protein
MMNLKVGHPGRGVHPLAVGVGVAEESQEMIVGVLVHRAETDPDPPGLNYSGLKPMAVSDCFYTDSWKMGSRRYLEPRWFGVGLGMTPDGVPRVQHSHQDSPFSVVEASFAVVVVAAVFVVVVVDLDSLLVDNWA